MNITDILSSVVLHLKNGNILNLDPEHVGTILKGFYEMSCV